MYGIFHQPEKVYDSMDEIPNGGPQPLVEFYKLQSLKQVNMVYNTPALYDGLSKVDKEHLSVLKEHFSKLESTDNTPGLSA